MKREVKRLYFLCGQNRCRSQMAQAFANFYGGSHVVVESAGLNPADEVHPYTIEVMREVGIDLSKNICKKIDMKVFVESNAIVKLCEQILERCPIVPFNIMNVDWNIPDPLALEGGSIEDVRRAREDIRENVIELLKGMNIPLA